jgi:pimeloyl-ACP methyl ester carboxylesterase/DNA-binding CsgD family transcriptional regulator
MNTRRIQSPAARYVTTRDGYDIAHAVFGEGVPLVYLPGQFSNLPVGSSNDSDWTQRLAERVRVVRFDGRGQGMSSRNIGDQSIETLGYDLDAVIEHLRLPSFVLFARWYASHIAVRYALAHPDRVAALVLIGCAEANSAWPSSVYNALAEENWEVFLLSQLPRSLGPEQVKGALGRINAASTRQDLAARARAFQASEITAELPLLRLPTLVLHPRDFLLLPAAESMRVAARIPGSRFAFIEGEMLPGDDATGVATIIDFLEGIGVLRPALEERVSDLQESLTRREIEILREIAAGKSNKQIAKDLVLSVRTVERHVTNLYAKIGARGKADATAFALRHGFE